MNAVRKYDIWCDIDKWWSWWYTVRPVLRKQNALPKLLANSTTACNWPKTRLQSHKTGRQVRRNNALTDHNGRLITSKTDTSNFFSNLHTLNGGQGRVLKGFLRTYLIKRVESSVEKRVRAWQVSSHENIVFKDIPVVSEGVVLFTMPKNNKKPTSLLILLRSPHDWFHVVKTKNEELLKRFIDSGRGKPNPALLRTFNSAERLGLGNWFCVQHCTHNYRYPSRSLHPKRNTRFSPGDNQSTGRMRFLETFR